MHGGVTHPGVRVSFYGVRGSTPCHGPEIARYGGNTSCVVLEADGHLPIVFDLGTGLRTYGLDVAAAGRAGGFTGAVLLTHLHWDHVQGLPFFAPLACGDARLEVHGPRQAEGSLGEVFAGIMRPPYFPVRPDELEGHVAFVELGDDDGALNGATIRSRWIRHVGPTLGFRVELDGVSVAYISDHGPGCCPDDPDDHVPRPVLELCDGVDLLIHDAQHTPAEFERKRHWGHCTTGYALHVAREAGARRLALFHHDPLHDDATVDRLLVETADAAAATSGPEVLAAAEGLVVELCPAGLVPQPTR
jgi:phosphoribosyl 1,2-cyclic phosphodiesterase